MLSRNIVCDNLVARAARLGPLIRASGPAGPERHSGRYGNANQIEPGST